MTSSDVPQQNVPMFHSKQNLTGFAVWMRENDISLGVAARLLGYDKSTICTYKSGKKPKHRRHEDHPDEKLEPDLVVRLAMAAISAGIREPAVAFASGDIPMRIKLALTAAALRLPPHQAA